MSLVSAEIQRFGDRQWTLRSAAAYRPRKLIIDRVLLDNKDCLYGSCKEAQFHFVETRLY